MINTAMSRARYSVAVVGDPVVLCTFGGSCRKIWNKYLNECESLASIYPVTYNVKQIKMQALTLAESDSGLELLRLLSQYRIQQQHQASDASAMARLCGTIGAGSEEQQAAAPAPSNPVSQAKQ